jgi:hypothetical protein
MTNENDLIQKLMVSKKIMERHDSMGRGTSNNMNFNSPEVENFKAPKANYNLPSEYMNESLTMGHIQNESEYQSTRQITQNPQPVTKDRIMSSKLPDEIKQLMMEHPISQPTNSLTGGSSISSDIAEKAARLMNVNAKGEQIPRTEQPRQRVQESVNYGISASDIKNIVRETVEDVLKENGLLVESTKKSNDVFKFRVGQHIFEGKVTKVRKVAE